MSLPSPNPALPSYPAPYFLDNSFVRGDQQRANNGFIWNNLEDLDTRITAIEGSVVKTAIDYGTPLAGVVYIPDERATNFTFNPASPRDYWPAINLSAIDNYQDFVSIAEGGIYPNDWVNYLEGINAKYLPGESGEVESFAVTISGVNITFPNTVSANAMLAAIVEDVRTGGSEVHDRFVEVGGSNYEISTINLSTRVMQTNTSPPSGSQTLYVKPYGTSTPGTCRVFAIKGEAIMAPNDPDGYFIMNLRTRGHFQNHQHASYTIGQSNSISGMSGAIGDTAGVTGPDPGIGGNGALSDGAFTGTPQGTYSTNFRSAYGDPLVRKITHGPAYTLIPYMWCGG